MDDDFVSRLRDEINSLEEKIDKLNAYVMEHHIEFDSIYDCLMSSQMCVMRAYKEILVARFKMLHKKEVE